MHLLFIAEIDHPQQKWPIPCEYTHFSEQTNIIGVNVCGCRQSCDINSAFDHFINIIDFCACHRLRIVYDLSQAHYFQCMINIAITLTSTYQSTELMDLTFIFRSINFINRNKITCFRLLKCLIIEFSSTIDPFQPTIYYVLNIFRLKFGWIQPSHVSAT